MSKKATETAVYRLLSQRIEKNSGNGPQSLLVRGVRSAAGFDARRTIDAVSLGLWPSRGMRLDAYEIKVSRSDWLRELRDPAKMEEFATRVDRVWLVTWDPTVARKEEIPEHWGWLSSNGKGGPLKAVVEAGLLHEGKGLPPSFNRSFLVPLLRSARVVPTEVHERLRKEAEDSVAYKLTNTEEKLSKLKADVAKFEEAAGVKIGERFSWDGSPEERGAAFRAVLDGDKSVERLRTTAGSIQASAERLVEAAKEVAGGDSL